MRALRITSSAGAAWPLGVLVHHARQQFLVQAAPVDADAHRLAVSRGGLDQGGELLVLLGAAPHVARVDAQLGQRLGAFRHGLDEAVAVEMEVADQGRVAAQGIQLFADHRDGAGGFLGVDGEPHQFRTGLPEGVHLGHGAGDVGGIGVGHGLHHHRRAAADGHMADQTLRVGGERWG
jgi:hypothetical protein